MAAPRTRAHPAQGLHSAAEESGLIGQIGMYVFRQACRQLRSWRALVPSSGHHCRGQFFATPAHPAGSGRTLGGYCRQHDVPACMLEIEMTESAMMADPEQARAIIERLRLRGFRDQLDDFGTGYSSLASLRKFPIDRLKLDRSFLSGRATTRRGRHPTDGRRPRATPQRRGRGGRRRERRPGRHACARWSADSRRASTSFNRSKPTPSAGCCWEKTRCCRLAFNLPNWRASSRRVRSDDRRFVVAYSNLPNTSSIVSTLIGPRLSALMPGFDRLAIADDDHGHAIRLRCTSAPTRCTSAAVTAWMLWHVVREVVVAAGGRRARPRAGARCRRSSRTRPGSAARRSSSRAPARRPAPAAGCRSAR